MKLATYHRIRDNRGAIVQMATEEERVNAMKEGREVKKEDVVAGTIIANHILSSRNVPQDKVARTAILGIKLEAGVDEGKDVELSDSDSALLKDIILKDDRLSPWVKGYIIWLVAPDSYSEEEREMFAGLQKL